MKITPYNAAVEEIKKLIVEKVENGLSRDEAIDEMLSAFGTDVKKQVPEKIKQIKKNKEL